MSKEETVIYMGEAATAVQSKGRLKETWMVDNINLSWDLASEHSIFYQSRVTIREGPI